MPELPREGVAPTPAPLLNKLFLSDPIFAHAPSLADVTARVTGKTAGSTLLVEPTTLPDGYVAVKMTESLAGYATRISYSGVIVLEDEIINAVSALTVQVLQTAAVGTVVANIGAAAPDENRVLHSRAGYLRLCEDGRIVVARTIMTPGPLHVVLKRKRKNNYKTDYFNFTATNTISPTVPPLPVMSILDNLEGQLSTWTVGSAWGSAAIVANPKLIGSGAFYGQGRGQASETPLLTKTLPNLDPSALDVIAFAVLIDDKVGQNQITVQFGRGGTYTGVTRNYSGQPAGWRWEVAHVSEIASIPTGAAATDLRFRMLQNQPYNAKVGFDAVVGNAKGQPTVVLGFDDGNRSIFDVLYPRMKARGLVGTLYLPWEVIADDTLGEPRISNKLVVSEVRQMVADGWAVCLDGTGNDSIMLLRGSTNDIIAHLRGGQAWLADKGFPAEGGNHGCYPNGAFRGDQDGQPAQIVACGLSSTTAGSPNVSFAAAAKVVNGQTIKGLNIPAGAKILSGGAAKVSSIVLSANFPTGTRRVKFEGPGGPITVDATGNGTTAVTLAQPVAVVDGMTCKLAQLDQNTSYGTVASGGMVGVTSVVLDQNVPVTQASVHLAALDETGTASVVSTTTYYHERTLPDALAAAGFKSFRTTIQAETYSRLGFGTMALMGTARTTSGASFATLKQWLDSAQKTGSTCEPYIHNVTTVGGSIDMKTDDAFALVDYIADECDAGRLVALTKPAWYARDVNGLANAVFA